MKKFLIILFALSCVSLAQDNDFDATEAEAAKKEANEKEALAKKAKKEADEKKAAAEAAEKKVEDLKKEGKPRNCTSTCELKWNEEQEKKIDTAKKDAQKKAAEAEAVAQKAAETEAVAQKAAGEALAKIRIVENFDRIKTANSIEMVLVEGRYFTMGCSSEQGIDCYDDERPAHNVRVNDFYIGKYLVTQDLWRKVMGANPSAFSGPDLPVESVSWEEIQLFIKELNAITGKKYRLLTESEWEYAARGGTKGKGYKYSGDNNLDKVAWYNANSAQSTQPVGTKQPNELGIYDMNGNVWEWVQDWKGDYSSSSKINPTGPKTGSYRVYRGGSYQDNALYCRVSRRGGGSSDYRSRQVGFRLALTP